MPNNGTTSNRFLSRAEIAAVILSVAFLIGHSIYAARINSVTVDEYVHLPAGISILRTGDLQLDHTGSPPLRAALALPALLSKPVTDFDNNPGVRKETYRFSWLFLANNFSRYHQLFFLPRMAALCFALLLALFVFLSARAIFGARAAAAATFLFCFNPTILAHAPLVGSDLLAGCFFLPLFISSSGSSIRQQRPAFS